MDETEYAWCDNCDKETLLVTGYSSTGIYPMGKCESCGYVVGEEKAAELDLARAIEDDDDRDKRRAQAPEGGSAPS